MPVPRILVDQRLGAGTPVTLPPKAARHAQVLRLQPGAALTLFDGSGGEWSAEVLRMGRHEVVARVLAHQAVERELRCRVTLALGMPANERMDALVEKATELGAVAIQPLVSERSVLRVEGERAERKAAHWQAVAAAACEQCGRNRLPTIGAPMALPEWIAALPASDPAARLMLSVDPLATALVCYSDLAAAAQVTLLSGPEGGLGAGEQALAARHGFASVSLGLRVLRADTAPLAALAYLAALDGRP
jgi:16S rRNA (uracil1498-N3)-methyltransferase